MSAMVISSIQKFVEMSKSLDEIGVSNIYFYNPTNFLDTNMPIIALLPFADFVVLSKDAGFSGHLAKVVDEAISRGIPVLSEDCLYRMKNFCY